MYDRTDTVYDKDCDRCRIKAEGVIMSMFNKDMICLDCISIERNHHLYGKAFEAVMEALRNKDIHYPGIGKPEDL